MYFGASFICIYGGLKVTANSTIMFRNFLKTPIKEFSDIKKFFKN